MEILFNFFVIFLDNFMCIPIFIVWACRYRWKSSLCADNSTKGKHLCIRGEILRSFLIQLLDLCLLPLGIFVFCTRYRWKTVVNSQSQAEDVISRVWWDSTKTRLKVFTTFGSVLVDIPFFIIGFFGVCLVW